MLKKTVKIILSPFNPNLEVVGPMVFDVRAPYSDKAVTLVVNPNITQYEDKPKKSVWSRNKASNGIAEY